MNSTIIEYSAGHDASGEIMLLVGVVLFAVGIAAIVTASILDERRPGFVERHKKFETFLYTTVGIGIIFGIIFGIVGAAVSGSIATNERDQTRLTVASQAGYTSVALANGPGDVTAVNAAGDPVLLAIDEYTSDRYTVVEVER